MISSQIVLYKFFALLVVHLLVNPFCQRSGELCVDSWFIWRGAVVSPADDAVLNSCRSFLADEWSARIALARIFAAICDSIHVQVRNASAEFGIFDLIWPVSCCDALLVRENVDSDVFKLKKRVKISIVDFKRISELS